MWSPRIRCLWVLFAALGGCGWSGEPATPADSAPPAGEEPPRTVLLIEWSGADPALVESMLSGGELPNLRRLAAEGAHLEFVPAGPPWTDVPWADPGMAGQPEGPSGGSFFGLVRASDSSMTSVAADDAERGAREWDLDLLADTGGWSNRGITEKAVVCITDLAEESTTAFIRYRAAERVRMLEADKALRTLRTALRILGLGDEARLYVTAASAGATEGDLAVVAVAAIRGGGHYWGEVVLRGVDRRPRRPVRPAPPGRGRDAGDRRSLRVLGCARRRGAGAPRGPRLAPGTGLSQRG